MSEQPPEPALAGKDLDDVLLMAQHIGHLEAFAFQAGINKVVGDELAAALKRLADLENRVRRIEVRLG